MKEQKKSIVLFFIYMLFIFMLVDVINQFIPAVLGRIIINSKYGTYILVESLAILVIFVVMMLSRNYYVFIQKRKNFFASLLVGGYMLGFSIIRLLLATPGKVHSSDLISLALYCVTIGVFEEFLCRGWLQNEFVERFGKNHKQVVLCIFLSSLVFGGMHITNIWFAGQGVFQTFNQIIQAVAMGMLLGGIYYRTKNIWSVAFLHGFWDFAIMLDEINVIRSCTDLTPSKSVMAYTLFTSLVLVIIEICIALFVLRPTKVSPLIEGDVLTEKEKNSQIIKNIFLILVPIFMFVVIMASSAFAPKDMDEYTKCFDYTERYLGDIDIHIANYNNNTINEDEYSFIIEETDQGLVLKNQNTKDEIVLFDYDKDLSYKIEIFKNDNVYHIGIYEAGGVYDGMTLYYTKYITTDNLSNDKKYLEEIKESLITYDIPLIKTTGYITKKGEDYKYIYGATRTNKAFFIDKDDKLYILTDDKNKQEEVKEEVIVEPLKEEQIEETA